MARHMLSFPASMDPLRYLVVGFDGSPYSELALFRALRITEFTQFALVHVVTAVDVDEDVATLPNGLRLSCFAASEALRLMATRLADTSNRQGRFARVVSHVRSGKPGPVLAEFARRYQADMVLVGARGIGESSSPLGSVTRSLLESLPTPLRIEALPLDRAWVPSPSVHAVGASRHGELLLSRKNAAPRVALN